MPKAPDAGSRGRGPLVDGGPGEGEAFPHQGPGGSAPERPQASPRTMSSRNPGAVRRAPGGLGWHDTK